MALAKILASASNCLDAYRHSYISHLLGLWTHSVSDGIEQFCYVLLFSPHLIDLAQLSSIVIPTPGAILASYFHSHFIVYNSSKQHNNDNTTKDIQLN